MGVELPVPDYQKAVADVYREGTVSILKSEGGLDVLTLVHSLSGSKTIPDLPSWVPNWSFDKHAKRPRAEQKFRPSKPQFSLHKNDTQIIVRGSIVDRVERRADLHLMHDPEKLGPPQEYAKWTINRPLPDDRWSAWLCAPDADIECVLRLLNVKVLRSLLKFSGISSGSSTANEMDILEQILYGVAWDLTPLLYKRDGLRQWLKMLTSDETLTADRQEGMAPATSLTFAQLATREQSILASIQASREVDQHHRQITDSASYQTLFRTASGRLGMAPYSVAPGDDIALVAGIKHPVVIRRRGLGHYGLVAFAYIHEFMDGQSWLAEPEELKDLVLI